MNAVRADGRSPTPIEAFETGEPRAVSDREDALELYRKLAAGVTVVTAHDDEEGPVGLTATAVTSVSLDPPLLLVCVATGSRTLAALRRRGAFAAHLLHSGQRAWAERFARDRVPASAKFDDVGWRLVRGAPVLGEALAWAVCAVVEARPYGDHSVVIGRLMASSTGPGSPLLWHGGGYRMLAPGQPPAPAIADQDIAVVR